MFKIIFTVCVSQLVTSQEHFQNIDDNIAMETVSGKNLDFSGPDTNRFSTFLSRAGEFFSDSDFGNKIKGDVKKPKVIHAVKVKEVSKETETNFPNKRRTDDKSLRNLTNQVKINKLTGSPINTNLVQSFLSGGKDVDDMQDELKDLLFGEEDAENADYIGKPATKASNNLTRSRIINQRKPNMALIDGDRAEFDDYEPSDYDLYSYDTETGGNRRMDAELPQPAELRQRRPYRPPRRRPIRGPIRPTNLRSQNLPNRNNVPPIRAPELHKVPGRIQGHQIDRNHNVPYSSGPGREPFKQRVFGDGMNTDTTQGVDCDFYTDDLCLGVREYPRQDIVRLLGANRRISDDMIADVTLQSADELIDGVSSNQENTYDFNHYFGNRREDDSHKHRDFAQDGGFLCPSEIKYAKPKRGKTAQGTWKDIVNVNDYTQTLRMEKCLKPGGSCSYVSHHYKSQCSQVYNYHRLLSWDQERGLHMDIYKVPTCCSCHIMGYSYVYPPLKKGAEQSPAIHGPPASGSSQLNIPPQRPLPDTQDSFQLPPQSARPAPQATPDSFQGPQQDLDNFIPDFNPQEELQAFMQSIGDDFKDFNFGKTSRPARNNQRPGPVRLPGNSQFRPGAGGFQPIAGNLRPPPPRNRRRGQNSIRRGDGFGPGGRPNGVENPTLYPDDAADDPLHKYETIPLDSTGFVKKKLDTGEEEEGGRYHQGADGGGGEEEEHSDSVNYGYHPIIDFFTPYRD